MASEQRSTSTFDELYVTDVQGTRARKVDIGSGSVVTAEGNPFAGYEDGPALLPAGSLAITDQGENAALILR